ncbi:Mimitin [Spatholobus suberectus]|nr:Mimitin [Spatholobus suberectus]
MQRLLGKIAGFLSNRTKVGVDKAGNKYFTRKEEIDGAMKEKRWVVFKGEEDPTSIPVEWICWLNGQRKKAPTPEEMVELEARRERVRQNVALLKKEEEERIAKEGSKGKRISTGKVSGPDLKSFIRQFPVPSEGNEVEESPSTMGDLRNPQESLAEKEKDESESSEPTGSGASFRPGTWQPPT